MLSPFIAASTKSISAGLISILAGVLPMIGRIMVHVFTLPTEFDASFNRALPILDRGNFIPKEDLPPARRLLKAAALTYVAGALASLLDILQWLRIFRWR